MLLVVADTSPIRHLVETGDMFIAPNKPIQPLTGEVSAGRSFGDRREQALLYRDVFIARHGTLRRAECLTRN